jgi:hypothetical protein
MSPISLGVELAEPYTTCVTTTDLDNKAFPSAWASLPSEIFAGRIAQNGPHAKPSQSPVYGEAPLDIKKDTMSPISLGVELAEPYTNPIRVSLLIPHPIILVLDNLFETDLLALVDWRFHPTSLLHPCRYVKYRL